MMQMKLNKNKSGFIKLTGSRENTSLRDLSPKNNSLKYNHLNIIHQNKINN